MALEAQIVGGPGRRAIGDDLAPQYHLQVNDVPINVDINQFIRSVEYESALDLADMMRIVIDNPGQVSGEWADWALHKAFQPGNQASLFMGYANVARPENFVGRVEWVKHLPSFPKTGVPQLEVKGYDLSYRMMSQEGPVFNAAKIAKLEVSRPMDEADNQGQVFANILHSDVVGFIADMYGFAHDIDVTERRDSVVLKKGMKHYEIVKSLANLNNRDFWVDYDINRRTWVLHWREINRNQKSGFTFRYGAGDASTLLQAEPEYGLRDIVTEATILVFDEKNKRWVSAIQIDDFSGPDPIFSEGGGLLARSTASRNPRAAVKKGRPKSEAKGQAARSQDKHVIKEAFDNASAFRIAAAGVAIDVLPPGRRFRDIEEAGRYLLRWFKERQDNFISVQGTVIGVESLRARQTHTLVGLGPTLDGDYFFTRARHVAGENYLTEFTANRVING